MEKGVIYIASGNKKYFKEACFSARSLKEHSPSISISLFTDGVVPQRNCSCFDRVIIFSEQFHPLKSKVKYLSKTPYIRTLFLDTDTEILKPIDEVFDVLDNYNFALCHTPNVCTLSGQSGLNAANATDTFNTGVILYNNNESIKELLHHWFEETQQQNDAIMHPGYFCDQWCLNGIISLYACKPGINMAVLPNAVWNVRPSLACILQKRGFLRQMAIYHGRPAFSRNGIRWHKAKEIVKRFIKDKSNDVR